MIGTAQIKEHVEIKGSDGQHVGTVDRVEGQRIKLTKSDQAAGGRHHYIELDMVDAIKERRDLPEIDRRRSQPKLPLTSSEMPEQAAATRSRFAVLSGVYRRKRVHRHGGCARVGSPPLGAQIGAREGESGRGRRTFLRALPEGGAARYRGLVRTFAFPAVDRGAQGDRARGRRGNALLGSLC